MRLAFPWASLYLYLRTLALVITIAAFPLPCTGVGLSTGDQSDVLVIGNLVIPYYSK